MNIAKIVREAREQTRLTALDFATGIFDDFVELHGDRSFRDDGAVIGGIGWLGDQAVTVVGIQKVKAYRIILTVTLDNLIQKAIEKLFV